MINYDGLMRLFELMLILPLASFSDSGREQIFFSSDGLNRVME